MQTILLIGVIIECVLLLALAISRKCTRKAFLIISSVTVICCIVVGILSAVIGGSGKAERSVKGHIYMAAQLLKEDRPDAALRALGQVTEAEGEAYATLGLRALAYNRSGIYSTGAYLLENETDPDLAALHDLCVQNQRSDDSLADNIIQASLELLALSEDESARYDAEMAIRYGGENDGVGTDSALILQVKAAIDNKEYETAYTLAAESASQGTMMDDILVSEMFVLNYNQRLLAQEDEGFDRVLREVTDVQVQLNRLAASPDVSQKEYDDCYAQYCLALTELDIESAKRAANYLENYYEEDSVYEIAYHLQMARLMLSAGDHASAEAHLAEIFMSKELDNAKWLAVDTMLLREAFLSGMGNIENPEFNAIYTQLMESLYQGVFKNVSIYSEFYEFLRAFLQDLHSGIYISRPDVSEYPTVKVSVSTASEIQLSTESLLLTDTQTLISDFTIQENPDVSVSICFVLDRSGSMSGTYIASAKQAIKSFAGRMDENMGAALVTFDNSAYVDCPLVDSPYMVAAQVDRVSATGGTNIAGGLTCGADQLASATGKKVIILLSDGVDGNSGAMPAAISRLKQEGIIVYSIGLPGCDEDYLSNIAAQTEGTYFPASNAASLTAIYTEINGFLRNSYTITYEVAEQTQTERTLWLEIADSFVQSRRKYSSVYESEEQYSQIEDEQMSSLFRQTGGSLGG